MGGSRRFPDGSGSISITARPSKRSWPDVSSLEERIKQQAHHLGFELAGIARAGEADGFERLRDWLDREYDGEMRYMRERAELLRHPSSVLPSVRSVVMVGMN